MKILKKISFVFFGMFLLSGCVTASKTANYTAMKQTEYRVANEKIHMSMGEKQVRGDNVTIIKGLLAGVGDLNMSVKNVDKELGFVVATGKSVIPGEIEKSTVMPMIKELQKDLHPSYQYMPGNYEIAMNISIYDYDTARDTSKVKVRVVNQVTMQAGAVNNELYPPLLREHYRYIWEKLSKHVFIEAETQ